MVKGISKQVIVVNSPDKEIFEQAIFILSDHAIHSGGVTNDVLLKEAKRIVSNVNHRKTNGMFPCVAYCAAGAVTIGLIWLLTVIL